ncbi:MAG: hypothetical protein ACRDGB_09810 [Candidatus Limnocylindria bacterium]
MRRSLPPLDSPVPALGIAMGGVFGAAALVRGHFDPDFFWHLATGRLILADRAIPTTDPFSFTWFGEAWVPDQWLAQVAIASVFDSIGGAALLVIFGVLAALGLVFIGEAMRREGARVSVIVGLTLVAGAALLSQVTARPQVASFAILGALLAILIRARPDSGWRLWLLPLLFLVWANTHGFFIVGLGVGFVYLVATFLGRTPMRERRMVVLGAGLASLIAAMLTPQGPAGVLYALSFGDAGDWGARNIAEWQSPNFHDPQFLPFLALLLMVLVVGIRRAPGWLTVIAVTGMALGLVAIRTIGVGALLILPAAIASASARLGGRRAHPSDPARRWLEVGVAGIVGVVVLGAALGRGPVGIDDRHLPVAGVEILSRSDPGVHVLASYGWGGYAISELSPTGGRVFVDGRMHKYAPDVLEDYLAIADASPGWERLAERYGVEAMLLRTDAVVTKGIAQEAGWCEVYRDDLQVLLLPACAQGGSTS